MTYLETKDVHVYWWNYPYIRQNLGLGEREPLREWKPEWLMRLEWLNLIYGCPQYYIFDLRTRLGKW